MRHALARIAPDAWPALVAAHGLGDVPLVCAWAARGWPLIVRRPAPGETGIALGLPLPPSAGKRRIALSVPPERIAAYASLPGLDEAAGRAPAAWRACLRDVSVLAARHRVSCRVFGALAWQTLTGLAYLHAGSDLDLLFDVPADTRALDALLDGLATLAEQAPMRIDGELVRDDGAGVNWRELHAGGEVAMKTATDVVLCAPGAFLAGR
ncbi:malonate decarboxylase holo-[acyl-carrier-protein] synthase [Burkholderia sp. FERM BP-3421]|nr:malonate decarboxylase holo-[acyl-carrier-protein] synthase [Burkholderia sp. FERM BP-3421]WDD93646.1 malonate decarboxylase holo-[acyl-carrier-protein] synthase [Burkholderia sp. FERM BP-3421]